MPSPRHNNRLRGGYDIEVYLALLGFGRVCSVLSSWVSDSGYDWPVCLLCDLSALGLGCAVRAPTGRTVVT